jgi:hypothetical protein
VPYVSALLLLLLLFVTQHHCRVDQINDTLLKISGLDEQLNHDGTGRED